MEISNFALPNGIDLKISAHIDNLKPEITQTIPTIIEVWGEFDAPKPMITSGNDSVHTKGSKHYDNLAIDLRGKNVTDKKLEAMGKQLRERLGPQYRVLVEIYPTHPDRDHIHVQYDPKPVSSASRSPAKNLPAGAIGI